MCSDQDVLSYALICNFSNNNSYFFQSKPDVIPHPALLFVPVVSECAPAPAAATATTNDDAAQRNNLQKKQAARQASHSALLGLLLPLFASALALQNLPALSEAIGQALLHAASSSGAAFKEAVAYVGAEERQALEGAMRAAIGRSGAARGAAGGRRGVGGGVREGRAVKGGTRKLDLSQYNIRG